MAKIIAKSDKLKKEYEKYRSCYTLSIVVTGGAFVLWILNIFAIHSFDPLFLAPCFFAFGGGAIATGHFKKKHDIVKSGLEGELAAAQLVASLPDGYIGYQNLNVPFDGKLSELDMTVIGPTGVFIIEVKNLNGSISGNYENNQWTQTKVGQQGTPYTKAFYSPVKQVETHVYRLGNFLRNNGVNVHVNSLVYFSNPAAEVSVWGPQTKAPVLSAMIDSDRSVRDYILNRDICLTAQQINQAIALMNAL